MTGIESSVETAETSAAAPTESSASNRWTALAWLLLGILLGLIAVVAYTRLITTPAAPLDAAAIRIAAREGTLDAIATLQAGGSAAESRVTSTPVVVKTAFAVRPANQVGNQNAAVTIVEFGDFQCPYCGQFYRLVKPALFQQYVDTGQAKFVYKHMAILGQESIWAAEAAECAADQDQFWAYHDLLFSRQAGENQGAFSKGKLLALAQELNLDMSRFEPCLKNDETLARVNGDTQEGQQAGVRGTPTFFVNGRAIVGAVPLQIFQQTIEQVLNEK